MHSNLALKPAVDPLVFHLTGAAADTDALTGMRPALLANYRDLTKLRYDFPLVLIEGAVEGAPVRSLTDVVDAMLRTIAPPGMESEQLRKMVLRIEREIRTLVADGANGKLSELWDRVAEKLEAEDAAFGKSARLARGALGLDGLVIDCDARTGVNVVTHLWSAVEAEKAKAFRARASRLAVKLSDILRADRAHSPAGRSADALRASVGEAHQTLFDFSALANVLAKAPPHEPLPEPRRRRLEQALAIITGQRFFAPAAGQPRPESAPEPHNFAFYNCADAMHAYRTRLPELRELLRALAVAELEVEGAYLEGKHDALFADNVAPNASDLALFPDYLLILRGDAADPTALTDALSSDAPFNVLIDVPEVADHGGNGHAGSSARAAQLASMIAGLGNVFVLQSVSSNLYRVRERILRGLSFAGPALISVFSGAAPTRTLPPYLVAASAMQSRAFPAFSYDPSAGADMAARFSLENNPQPETDWAVQRLVYADPDMQRVRQNYAFTFADLLVCDERHQHRFRLLPADFPAERLVSVAEWLAQPQADAAIPYVLLSDETDGLARAVVDDHGVAAARRCLDRWHRLQETCGVHNSFAERLVKQERSRWEEQHRQEAVASPAPAPAAASTPAAAAAGPAPAAEAAAVPERSPDEAYIETERCSTCNECTLLNDRMFAYNDNKQAYIKDIKAGTYAQLVEAAESCQLGIIHPGKPTNPNEPGLDELLKRAEPFW
jgi:hypothetical protein